MHNSGYALPPAHEIPHSGGSVIDQQETEIRDKLVDAASTLILATAAEAHDRRELVARARRALEVLNVLLENRPAAEA